MKCGEEEVGIIGEGREIGERGSIGGQEKVSMGGGDLNDCRREV